MRNEKYIDETLEIVDNEAFIDIEEDDMIANPPKHLKIGIVSKTTNVFINRNNSSEAITSYEVDGEMRVHVPSVKFRGAEQSEAVKIVRGLGLMPDSYKRNLISDSTGLLNPVSALYGDSVTAENEHGQLRSRISYDWSLSMEPLAEVTKRIQHNTLQEDGTILKDDEGNTKPEALHNTKYVMPGVEFVRFVTLENTPPELFLLYLASLISRKRYGGRTSITGNNIENEVVAIGYGPLEAPLTSYTMAKELNGEDKSLTELLKEKMGDHYGEKCITGDDIEELEKIVHEMLNDKNGMKELLEPISGWVEESFDYYA